MILISGNVDTYQEGTGGFQETDQLHFAKTLCKYYARPNEIARIPIFIEKAIKASIYGPPGPVYIDLPGDLLSQSIEVSKIQW